MASDRSASARRSLRELHPKNFFIPIAVVGCLALLLTALSLPLLRAQQVFWKSEYSVWAGVVALWHENEILLALILFFFSIVFPIVKLTVLAYLWLIRLTDEQRTWLLRWLDMLGKWSMLDVFVVAILIVLVKLGPMAKVEPRVGVYVFTAAIAASMLTTMYVERLAKRSSRPSGR